MRPRKGGHPRPPGERKSVSYARKWNKEGREGLLTTNSRYTAQRRPKEKKAKVAFAEKKMVECGPLEK